AIIGSWRNPPDREPPTMCRRLFRVAVVLVLAITTSYSQGGESPGHWAFVPPVRPAIPAVRSQLSIRSPLDWFVQATLEQHGVCLAQPSDRATLLRRVCIDLTGLPPAPDDIIAFQNDSAEDAFERMIERYLASPRYGERWGKYWLDAAGYADSNGY